MSSESSSNSEAAVLPEHRREETSTDISSSGSTEHSSNASLVRKNSRVVEVGSSSRVPIRSPEQMDQNVHEPESQVPADLDLGREPDVKTDEDALLQEVGEGGAQDPNDDDMMPIIDRPSVSEPEERPWDAPEDFICVYEAYFREAGMTFLLPRILFAYCNRRGCAVSQLQSATIVNFIGILQLGRDIRTHINVAQFEELFIMKVSTAKSWFLSANCNPKFDLVTRNKASKFADWDKSYFFVRVDSHSAENPESTFRTGWSVDFDRHIPGFLQRSLTTDLTKRLSLARQRRWPRAYQEKIDRRIKRAQERVKTQAEPSSSKKAPRRKNPKKRSKKTRRMAFDRSDIPMMNFAGDDEDDNAPIDIVGLEGNEVGDGTLEPPPVDQADAVIPVTDPAAEEVGIGVPEATPQPQMEEGEIGEIGEQNEDELTIADRARRKKEKSSKKSSRKRVGDPEAAVSEGTMVLHGGDIEGSPAATQDPPEGQAVEAGNPRQIVPASTPMRETKDLFRPKSYARVARSASALVYDTNELVREYDSEVERLRKINADVAVERASLEGSYRDKKERYEASVLAFTEKEKENVALKEKVGALEKRAAKLEVDLDALSKSFKMSELERRRYRDAESKGRKMMAALRSKCEGKLAKIKDFMDKSELRKAPFLKLN
ncbi:meiosis-specific protein ASY2-like [Eutrema salsugineum]|uniref:meiosis-specific protein ASY2-like n=1 Tax=Eutrema salsugineum TaxID=72664 RepID=UPI000CECFDE2|nr:meiosis-specific protein ASY2-like [Eutrema salsugineum]